MTTLVVINPGCRNGDDAEFGEMLEVLLPLGKLATHTIGKDGDLAERVKKLGDELERLVIGGGDGTLNNALPVALQAGVPVGVLPIGTANDFARALQLPRNPVAAAEVIAAGFTSHVDVGLVNGRHFLNAVGIGLGPELTRKMDRQQKKRLGVLAYLENLIQVLGGRKRRWARIVVDDHETRLPFLQVTVANGRHYGGGMTVCQDVEMNDGLLHVLAVRPLKPAEMVLRAFKLRFGTVKDDEKLVYLKGRKVEVHTRRNSEVTADGELVTGTPVRCECLPRALRVYVPESLAEEAVDLQHEPDLLEATG